MLKLSWFNTKIKRECFYYLKDYQYNAAKKGQKDLARIFGAKNVSLEVCDDFEPMARDWMFRDISKL